MLNFEFFNTSGTATEDGVFIPISNLVGVTAGEFSDAVSTAIKESKLIYSVLNVLSTHSLANVLGMSITVGNVIGQAGNLSTKQFTFSNQYYADIENQIVSVLPLPLIGSQVGVGELSIVELFSNAVLVSSGGAVSGEGVVIPTSLLLPFGSSGHSSLNVATDCRKWVTSFLRYVVSAMEVRSASVASALTAKTIQNTGSFTLPAIATDATNPTTGLSVERLIKVDTFNRTFSWTFQRAESEVTQTFDVHVVTA